LNLRDEYGEGVSDGHGEGAETRTGLKCSGVLFAKLAKHLGGFRVSFEVLATCAHYLYSIYAEQLCGMDARLSQWQIWLDLRLSFSDKFHYSC
jgi:hypothetical protein